MVSYKKLFHLLIERDISGPELQKRCHFSGNVLSRARRGKYLSLESIEKICTELDCGVDDILEFKPDGEKS